MTITDHEAFIRSHTRLLPVPHAPEISLFVADEATALWQKTEEELGEMGLPPPFWAFAWAGGQALARYVLDYPDAVAELRVLDFAAGSGLVGIAAAKAGAESVEAADIDPFAASAIRVNSLANDVRLKVRTDNIVGRDEGWDVVLAGDICYERDLAEAVFAWLVTLQRRGARVLIGDPGRSYLPKDRLDCLATYRVPVTRALEDAEIKTSRVWQPRITPGT
ncbi:putative nicotinamide N-methyase [Pseudochelatococcus lubricantis]|uniref:Nicotinamide N-methyase n=1 Tax=Pseudochelatococcus lubricantis TaxID=1538102 RepID=A0ABX0UZJ0_9HYPH|nr:methyltransferase [Pseudochelatococcus lubricantis]NIJ58376.1 putative nicotinamide N-methyase [Pseudochelatococcus lubricantis]